MAQHMFVAQWLVSDKDRSKAEIKYQIRQLEHNFDKILSLEGGNEELPVEVHTLCESIAQHYVQYLKLIDDVTIDNCSELPLVQKLQSWQKQYDLIINLKQQLAQSVQLKEERKLIIEIASLYYHLKQSIKLPYISIRNSPSYSEQLKKIFKKNEVQLWLGVVVDFYNSSAGQSIELSSLFEEWDRPQQQLVLDFFSSVPLVNLVNTLFFYKLHPELLFEEHLHPEKLVSTQSRLSHLHQYIEMLEQQLHSTALQYGLKPPVDHLFHGNELPKGVMVEVNDGFRELIQEAIKQLKTQYNHVSEGEGLHDLEQAYKFGFNANRLIDAAMMLEQKLMKTMTLNDAVADGFRQEMLNLFAQLTTTQCLYLYGHFASDDTSGLLYTLFAINTNKSIEWLPIFNGSEKNAVTRVFEAIKNVIEALRDELKNRHVTTQPYVYDLEQTNTQPGRRHSDAVFRIIAIYAVEEVPVNNAVEHLFSALERG